MLLCYPSWLLRVYQEIITGCWVTAMDLVARVLLGSICDSQAVPVVLLYDIPTGGCYDIPTGC